jgi:hypothetical protein
MSDVSANDLFRRRVCLKLDGVDAVTVRRDLPYGSPEDPDRVMDIYHPPQPHEDVRWPVVVIVAGYPGAYRKIGWAVSMAQLIAASGMAAVAYANREPVADLRALLECLHEETAPLRLDASRIGIVAASGNAPTALATVMHDWSRPPCCAAFSYGCLLDLDGAADVADAARQAGFADACAGRSIRDLRRDVPLFIAGRDAMRFPR